MSSSPTLLEILVERARCNSKRGSRADPYHVALVVESGGMRGAAAGGSLQVLADAHFLNSFDTLHGSSAGACAVTYFLAEQLPEARLIYHQDICNRSVVNPLRFFSHPCMVDTDYIVDTVLRNRRTIRPDRITDQPGVLHIVTSSVSTGTPAVHSKFTSSNQIYSALKASLRVPGPCEPGIRIADTLHLDGGIVAPIPVFSAVKSGATHILIIGTRRLNDYFQKKRFAWVEGLLLTGLYGRQLATAYRTAHDVAGSEIHTVQNTDINVEFIVRPIGSTCCGWSTIDKNILLSIEKEGALVTREFIKKSIKNP